MNDLKSILKKSTEIGAFLSGKGVGLGYGRSHVQDRPTAFV